MTPRLTLRTAALAATCGCATLASAASLEDIPNRKPGLWEIKMMSADARMPQQTMQQCTDASTDADMRTTFSPMAKEMCSQQNMQKTATGYSIDATCSFHGIASTSHTDISGDFNSAYTVKVSSKNAGAPAGVPAESATVMEAKWLGGCKADQKAGDIVMPGGMKINIKDMQALKGMLPKK